MGSFLELLQEMSVRPSMDRIFVGFFNLSRPNSDLSQISHCNNKGLSVSEVMRTENMITQDKFY